MDVNKEYHTTQGPTTVTYTTSDPVVTYTTSEPTVTYTTTESEPVVTYTTTTSEPVVTYTTTKSEPVVTYTTTKSEPVVTYSSHENPSAGYTTTDKASPNESYTITTTTTTTVPENTTSPQIEHIVTSVNTGSAVPTDVGHKVPTKTVSASQDAPPPAYQSEKSENLDTKSGLHDTSADSNEQGNVEEYDEQGNLINFIMSPGEKSLLRKLDFMYVMPYICVLNFLQFLDKSSLNYASVLGILKDANLTSSQYSWVSSIFYLGYLVFQGPSMILIQKLPLRRYIGSIIVLWGLVLLLTYKGSSFAQLAGIRFLLGLFEAGVYPCCIMLISSMYRRNEQAGRIGLVYICNGVAMTIGGFIGYGIGYMNAGGLSPWMWIMIILGAITIVFGFVSFFFMVDSPKSKVLRLTPEEEKAVDDRTRDNAVVYNKSIKMDHIYEALKEPRFYIFCVCSLLINLQNSALNNFMALITKGFGFSSLNALLLGIPSGVTDIIYISVAVWYNRRYGNTLYTGCILLGLAILGLILLVVIPVPKAKLLGLYLVWAFAAGFVMLLVSVANNVAGYTKKAFYSSALMVFYTFGNFIGPFLMVPSQAPLYVGGMVGCIVANAVAILLLIYARRLMAKENLRRMANPTNQVVLPNMTDVENENFIYRL